MKNRLTLILFFLFFISCYKEDNINSFSYKINFDPSEWILKDLNVNCIDFDKDGNAWFGSGSNLIFFNKKDTKVYNVGSTINDVSVAPDGKIWIATYDKGLVCFTGKKFISYNSENADFPRDYVSDVEVDKFNKVWFGCSAFKMGGLMSFDGQKFELFTPENSPLNQNIIDQLKINKKGVLYIATVGTVGKTVIYRIEDNNWYPLGDEEGTFYWVSSMAVGENENIYVNVDYSLSSFCCRENYISVFSGKQWDKLDFNTGFFPRMIVDNHGLLWVTSGNDTDIGKLNVYNGNLWYQSPKGKIPDVWIKAINVDNNNNIWLCTDHGIIIINQK